MSLNQKKDYKDRSKKSLRVNKTSMHRKTMKKNNSKKRGRLALTLGSIISRRLSNQRRKANRRKIIRKVFQILVVRKRSTKVELTSFFL